MLKSMDIIVKFRLKSPELLGFELNIEVSFGIDEKNQQKKE